MHAWTRWAILIAIAALSASVASPARATLGDCTSVAYRGQFDARLRERPYLDFDCFERMRIPVGERQIRIVHDFSADWIVSDSEMAHFDRGVRAAAEAIGRLGGVAMDDVTILLADYLPPRDPATGDFSDIAALTDQQRDDECRIIVFLAGPGSLPENAAYVIAHELFHCVQTANLSDAQMSSGADGGGGGGDWWLEGSADWFAALALPDAGPLPDRVDGFDANSPTTPLNRMAYEAVVFFLWLAQERSPPGVMDFLRAMAGERSEAAQRAAMAAALPQERWLAFAEAYLDGAIRHPHGADIGLSPTEGDTWQWTATRTQAVPLEPFVLTRGVVAFTCGHWRASVRPSGAYGARPEEGGAWGGLPDEVDTTSGSGGSYRFAALNAAGARVRVSIEGTMESACGDCAGVRTADACVVGAWRLTAGGPAEWMRRRGVPAEIATRGETFAFRADGTYVSGALSGEVRHEGPTGTRGEGAVRAQAAGRWSTRGNMLNLCADMQALAGRVTVTTPEGARVSVPMPSVPPSVTHPRYNCSGDTLDMEMPVPGAPPIPSQFARIGGG